MAPDTTAETAGDTTPTQAETIQKQLELPGHQIAKLLLKGATKKGLVDQGFKPDTVNDWLDKLKAYP